MGNQIFDEKAVVAYQSSIEPSTTTSWQQIGSSPSGNAWRADAIYVKSSSASPAVVTIGLYWASQSPSTAIPIGSAVVPASAGDGTVPLCELLALVFGIAGASLICTSGMYLAAHVGTTLSGGTILLFFTAGGEL